MVIDGPCGIAIETTIKVYVSELRNNRVSVFTSDGHVCDFVWQIGKWIGTVKHSLWTI